MSYVWLNEYSKKFLEMDYLVDGQSVDDRVNVICNTAEKILKLPGYGQRLKACIEKGWFSLSSPIWSNFGTKRGLPISCFGSHIEDTMESILYTQAEIGMMTKYGGGTSADLGNLRPRGSGISIGGHSSGAVHFSMLYDTTMHVVSQGQLRRGNWAGYLSIAHKDINEFLTIKSDGSPIQNIFFGVTIKDDWMHDMVDGDKAKRKVWAKVLECRANIGLPYIIFLDNVNKNTVDVYKENHMEITASNLCTEIFEPTTPTESFVCDLASMNDFFFDEWKDTDAVEILTYLLDAVMTEFIDKAKHITFLERAVKFAERHRALGIGRLGWHSLLQSKMIPFESMEAQRLNMKISKTIKKQAYEASAKLAKEYGEPELLKGYGRRNAVLLAIAPTKSSSFILMQMSEAIQPELSNIYNKDLAKGKFSIKNRYLEALLETKGENKKATWDSIMKKGGSVQHLACLDEHEKSVFKTFQEISQKEIIIQASQRQKYIDQGQSLNLMIHPSIPIKDVNKLLIDGWELGIKSFYYQISVNAAQAFSRNILTCSSCEG